MAGEYDIEKAFERIENELIDSMMRNFARHRDEEDQRGIDWSMWQAEQLKTLEAWKKANAKKYPGQFSKVNKKIETLLRKTYGDSQLDQEREILEAIRDGFLAQNQFSDAAEGSFFKLNEQKLDALIKSVTGDFEKAETAILRRANDQYRQIIYAAQVYANTGAGTYEKAVDMATKDFLSRGIDCIEYKNGARHNIKDYSRMAIRTANKRAQLQGEGAKRREWGISTVTVHKRGNPCPKCLPFTGKVFVDDVWSGGNKDGKSSVTGVKYPLMSTAIAAGLYHPNCKDGHSTYYEGVDDPPDDRYTRDELDALAEKYQKEQKAQHAKRQAEKYERLAKYSLDPENQKEYTARAKQWKPEEMVVDSKQAKIAQYANANSLGAAQIFAEKYCESGLMDKTFKGKVDFKGISLDHANEINRALSEIYEIYDIPKITGIKAIDPNSAKGKKVFSSSDAVMAYSPIEHGIYLNKKILKDADTLAAYNKQSAAAWDTVMQNIEKLTGAQKDVALRYQEAGRSLVGDGSAHDYFIHELGHHIQWEAFDPKTNNSVGSKMGQYSGKISGYATASKSEYFAESFAAYVKGENSRLDPEYIQFLESKVKKSVVKTNASDIMKSGAITGARNPYGEAAERHAEKYYGLVRKMKTDVSRISKTTGISEDDIQAIKDYLFMQEHDLGAQGIKRFDPDYMIGESWRRLIDGNPEPHDLTLLRHEMLEKELMAGGLSQDEAHRKATAKYNYDKEANEFYGKISKFKKE